MVNEIEKLSTEQATWLYKIREDSNFYRSLTHEKKLLVYNILKDKHYRINLRDDIEIVRQLWIRYVKLNNHRAI
jgi:hypothetical protein